MNEYELLKLVVNEEGVIYRSNYIFAVQKYETVGIPLGLDGN
jgi:hypothetical protein